MKSLRCAKTAYIIYSAILILLGLLFMIFPDIAAQTSCIIFGIAMIGCGIIKLLSYFTNDSYGLAFQFDFALGLFCLLIGFILILKPESSVLFLGVVIGLFVILDGVLKLQTAKEARSFGLSRWWIILLFAVLSVSAGVLVMFNPFEGTHIFAILIGISVLLDGLENIAVAISAVKLVRRMGKSQMVEAEFREIK